MFAPTRVDAADTQTTEIPALGRQACTTDSECAPIGGTQRCLYGGCVPACLLDGRPVRNVCQPLQAACVAP